MDVERLYSEHRRDIDASIRAVLARARLSSDDADDFASDARLHLIKDDAAVLRAFEKRSSLRTYLAVVLGRLFQDWRNSRWGKWRPTVAATRLGPTAIRLETLTARDRYAFEEAVEVILSADPTVTRADLEWLWAQLPVRTHKTFTGVDALEDLPALDRSGESLLLDAWARSSSERIAGLLSAALKQLPTEDRLLVAMRFEDGLSVKEIARRLNRKDPRTTYRQLTELLGRLRASLEAAGVRADEALDAMQRCGLHDVGTQGARGIALAEDPRMSDDGPVKSPAGTGT